MSLYRLIKFRLEGDFMEFDFENLKVQGIKFNYYFVCKRKLWLFDKGISMEDNSDRVLHGKVVHENSYIRSNSHKEKLVDDIIKLDIMENETVKEVKLSSKMKISDRMQILYYLFYLKQIGINKKGAIHYVKEKRIEEVELTEDDENRIRETLLKINEILRGKKPPKIEKLPYCKKCAYYEFCYAGERD